MKWLAPFLARFGFVSPAEVDARVGAAVALIRRHSRRSYDAGAVNRLTADFTTAIVSPDTDLVRYLRIMRARSRQLFKNDPYCRRFVKLIEKNIVGSSGIGLVMRVIERYGPDGEPELDRLANAQITAAWTRWGKPPTCTVDRQTSWAEAQRRAARTWVVDGEAFLVFDEQPSNNPFGFSVRFLSADLLDEDLNVSLPGGSTIRMGVEKNADGAPVAYHFWTRDPYDYLPGSLGRQGTPRVRIPAERVVHLHVSDFPGQTRGVPWLYAAIARLNMLGGYEEAELVASRVAANKLGFMVMPEGEEYAGEGQDCQGYTMASSEPGSIETVPAGTELKNWDPQHPNANFSAFQQAMLRGVACAGDVSYHSLAGDLSSVNYSSARIGLLDERDGYMLLQSQVCEQLCDPVFSAWLESSLEYGALPLPLARLEKFNAATWRPRRWAWVDPQKEVNAAAQAVALRIKSRTQIIQENGGVPEQVWAELCHEEELLKACGLTPPPAPAPGAPATEKEGDEKTDDDEEKPASGGRLNGHNAGIVPRHG